MNFSQNSVITLSGRRGEEAEGSKTQNLPFFKPIDKKSKNQPPKSIRRGNMRISLSFDFEKVPFLPYLPS